MIILSVDGVSKLKKGTLAVNDIHFTQQKYQKVAIAGETGSGKSTLLKIIAGLEQPDDGNVIFEGKRVRGPEEKLLPGHPHIAYLSQHFELRNNYRVEEVLEMANKMEEAEAEKIYEICRITHLLKRWTNELSGGEKQRIATARLLVTNPTILLLDEPYSNLDPDHKQVLKEVIHDISNQLNITCIMVSHDPLDTLSWADEIIVMRNGKIVQQATPEIIYRQPKDEYCAALFGKYILLSPEQSTIFKNLPEAAVQGKSLLIRPEHLHISNNLIDTLPALVKGVKFFGSFYEIIVRVKELDFCIKSVFNHLKTGDTVNLQLDIEKAWFI